MYLPYECWGHIHTFLSISEFCWPVYIPIEIRRRVCFEVRVSRALPLYRFHNLYSYCVVSGCTASRGAFRDLVVSPYCVQHACQWSCPRILYFRVPVNLH